MNFVYYLFIYLFLSFFFFLSEEYTKITTPRQDVLFKKGYFGRKKESSIEENVYNNSTNGKFTEGKKKKKIIWLVKKVKINWARQPFESFKFYYDLCFDMKLKFFQEIPEIGENPNNFFFLTFVLRYPV